MDDDDLLRQCQRGDDASLTELLRRHQDSMFRLAFRVLADPARAEDAAADALATVWLRCRSWRGDSSAGTWIHQVAWRVILDHHRSRGRWWKLKSGPGPATNGAARKVTDPAEIVADAEERAVTAQKLTQALSRLSAEQRGLVHLHYYEQQSLAEIAAVLGISRDAVKMRLSRARKELEGLLGDIYD